MEIESETLMTARLAGRVAIVTGASRGLGRATALALAAEGAAVAVVARTEVQWDQRLPGTIGETVAAIEEAGGRAVAIRADLLARDDIVRLVAEARAMLGPITILINNAAFTAPGRPPTPGAPASARAPVRRRLVRRLRTPIGPDSCRCPWRPIAVTSRSVHSRLTNWPN